MSLIDNIKTVAEVFQKADNIELYRKVLNMQAEVMDLMERNLRLREENRALCEKLEIKQKLTYRSKVYWDTSTDPKDGPFCPRCWDADEKLIRLHHVERGLYDCRNCNSGPINILRDEGGAIIKSSGGFPSYR